MHLKMSLAKWWSICSGFCVGIWVCTLWFSMSIPISMGYYKKDITPLLTHWSYVFLARTHEYVGMYDWVVVLSASIICEAVNLLWIHERILINLKFQLGAHGIVYSASFSCRKCVKESMTDWIPAENGMLLWWLSHRLLYWYPIILFKSLLLPSCCGTWSANKLLWLG